MHFKNIFFINICLSIFYTNFSTAQSSAVPLGNDAYHIIDRLEIKTGKAVPFATGMKPYLRKDVARYALDVDTSQVSLSQKDRLDLYWLLKDNNEWLAASEFSKTLGERRKETKSHAETSFESDKYIERKPFLKYFYRSPANFAEINKRYFHLRLNPILNTTIGKDSYDSEKFQFLNLRGLELRGGIDDRVYFYANLEENQARFAPYVHERIVRDTAILGANLYKPFSSQFVTLSNAYDWSIAQGYIGFHVSKHIGIQFGHGRNFLGDGYRSLLLSDNSTPHLYLKINSTFWRFQYQNIFSQFSNANIVKESGSLRRYFVGHKLTFKASRRLDLSIFEGIMIHPRQGDQFDLNYLNPVIFYRSVEYISGSQDNALVGATMKYNFLRRFSLYGQLMLDEFNTKYLFGSPSGWWANKFAIQGGLKYIDMLGIDHLDGRVEYNLVRPYTYFHYNTMSYTNLRQPLAHPLGANLKEINANIRYQYGKKWVVNARLIHITTGEDSTATRPYGQNLLSPYYRHPKEFGNTIGQGIATNILMGGIDLSYQFFHNMYAELQYFYRRKDSADNSRDQNMNYFGAGLRINIAPKRMDW